MKLSTIFLEFFGAGRLPSPPLGATLAAFAVGMGLLLWVGAESLFTLAFALFIVGVLEIDKFERAGGEHDDPRIAIDETVGLWVALSVAGTGGLVLPDVPFITVISGVLALASFFLYLRWAPSTIGWIRRNLKGGLGVMSDDVLAGFAAGLSALLLLKVAATVMQQF